MKTRIAFFAIAVAVFAFASQSTTDTASDSKLYAQISDIILECQKIKPGMTRADLLKVFIADGGIRIPDAKQGTFVYLRCSCVKVDVQFSLSPGQGKIEERPTDTITSISRPYREFAFTD